MSSLLDWYLEYHKMRTNAPIEYGTHLGIQLFGHALGREAFNNIAPRAVRHNTYVNLLGQSQRSKKTTAQEDIMTGLIPKARKGPKHFSPQGLLVELEQKPSMIICMGEFSSYLRNIKSGGYMAPFKELSNELLSCPIDYDKRLRDVAYFVRRPYLSLNTTCTVEEFFENLKPETVEGGFLPRWINVYKHIPKGFIPRPKLPDDIDLVEKGFNYFIRHLYKQFNGQKIVFELTDQAMEKFEDICCELENDEKYEGVLSFVSRIENYIIAYADILYYCDEIGSKLSELSKISKLSKLITIYKGNKDLINLLPLHNWLNLHNLVLSKYVEQAYELLKPSLDYSIQISSYINDDYRIAKVKARALSKFDKKQDWSTCLRNSGLRSTEFVEVIKTLMSRKEIEIVQEIHGEEKAKKITRYILKTEQYL